MITIQLLGILIGIAAIHLTHIYYKRANFTKQEMLFWIFIWIAFIAVSLFPHSVRPVVGYLGLQRPMDLIMIIAFIIIFALTFHNYVMNNKIQQRIEHLIRELALNRLQDPKSK